jgi:RNA polymerase sigma-70 factor (ECF subfamily)
MIFEAIYTEHKNLVYNLSLQYTQNTEDAEEVTQDVFLAVHQKIETFRNQSALKTWIYRITINKSLDFLKAKRRKKRIGFLFSLNSDDETVKHKMAHFNHPGIVLEQQEATAKIFHCINQLPDNQKNAIILLKIEQLPIFEVAVILDSSVKAVESLFQRGKKNLEILLNQNEEK